MPEVAGFLAEWLFERRRARRRKPGFVALHPSGVYGLQFSAEQALNAMSRVTLGIATDPAGMRRMVVDWQISHGDRASVAGSLCELRTRLARSGEARIEISDAEIKRQPRCLSQRAAIAWAPRG